MKKDQIINLILDKIKSGENFNFEEIQDSITLNNDFSEISGLVNSINAPNAQKRKYYNSIILSKIVAKTVEWFKSDEGKEWMNSQNKKWTNEKIGKNIFGWQKSFWTSNPQKAEGLLSLFRLPLNVACCHILGLAMLEN